MRVRASTMARSRRPTDVSGILASSILMSAAVSPLPLNGLQYLAPGPYTDVDSVLVTMERFAQYVISQFDRD